MRYFLFALGLSLFAGVAEAAPKIRIHVQNRRMLPLVEAPNFPFTTAPTNKTVSLYFVGNSYTYVNDVPGMVKTLATSRGRNFTIASTTPGGETLWRQLTQQNVVSNRLVSTTYDYVILQDQSNEPSGSAATTGAAIDLATKLVKARDPKSQLLLYVTPAHFFFAAAQARYSSDEQVLLNKGYLRPAKRNKLMTAPVGEVFWHHYYNNSYDRVLHAKGDDYSHFSIEGSYIAAAVIYCTITGESAIGLPNAGSLNLDDATRRYYQELVDETLLAWRIYLRNLTDADIAEDSHFGW